MAKNVSITGGNDWGGLGRGNGGNCADGKGEAHGAAKARQIAQGGTTGKGGSFGPIRQNGDGNEPAIGEKHDDLQSPDTNGQAMQHWQTSCVADPKHGSKKAQRVLPSQRF